MLSSLSLVSKCPYCGGEAIGVIFVNGIMRAVTPNDHENIQNNPYWHCLKCGETVKEKRSYSWRARIFWAEENKNHYEEI